MTGKEAVDTFQENGLEDWISVRRGKASAKLSNEVLFGGKSTGVGTREKV